MTYEKWITLLDRGPLALMSTELKKLNDALKEYLR